MDATTEQPLPLAITPHIVRHQRMGFFAFTYRGLPCWGGHGSDALLLPTLGAAERWVGRIREIPMYADADLVVIPIDEAMARPDWP